MAIAHGSEILGVANTGTTPYDTAITPAATPNGVCVIIVYNATTDQVTAVTYGIGAGAVPLARQRWDTEATEVGSVMIYWAAGIFPTSTQTVRIDRTGTTSMRAAISTMTIANGFHVEIDNSGSGLSASVANPSWTHSSLVTNVVAYLGIHSGLTTMTNTPAANWTLGPTPGFEDYGAQGRGWARRTLVAAGSLGAGWTAATADDFVGSSISFKEVSNAAARAPMVVGREANRRASRW